MSGERTPAELIAGARKEIFNEYFDREKMNRLLKELADALTETAAERDRLLQEKRQAIWFENEEHSAERDRLRARVSELESSSREIAEHAHLAEVALATLRAEKAELVAATIERCAEKADVLARLQSIDMLCRFGADIAAAIRALAKATATEGGE